MEKLAQLRISNRFGGERLLERLGRPDLVRVARALQRAMGGQARLPAQLRSSQGGKGDASGEEEENPAHGPPKIRRLEQDRGSPFFLRGKPCFRRFK